MHECGAAPGAAVWSAVYAVPWRCAAARRRDFEWLDATPIAKERVKKAAATLKKATHARRQTTRKQRGKWGFGSAQQTMDTTARLGSNSAFRCTQPCTMS